MSQLTDVDISSIERYVVTLLGSYPKNLTTRTEYSKIFERIFKYCRYDLICYASEKLLSKSTFYRYKAAYQYGLAFTIEKHIQEYKKSFSENHLEQAALLFALLKNCNPKIGAKPEISSWFNQKSLYPEEEIRSRKTEQGKPNRKPRRQQRIGKRASIIGLHDGWQWDVCRHVKREYRFPALVLSLTGCRPAELAKGIELFIKGDLLMCRILGSKVSATKGHRTRIIGFDPNINPIANFLSEALKKFNTKRYIVKLPDGNSADAVQKFGDKIRYAAQRKLGLKKVSAYSCRHQVASDLRQQGFSHTDIAMILGHRTTRMRKHYGLNAYGKGGANGIKFIDASEKESIRTTYHEQPPLYLSEATSIDNPFSN